VEALEASLARMRATEPQLNAFVTPLAAMARRDAEAADLRRRRGEALGALHGVPVSVKDLIAVGGAPFTLGSRSMAHNVAPADAASIERLRRAGAIVVG
jgi:aspartyl-tRNA(Asn)/glutamyl-tRNA(Gln) amidotransferase subunit A